MKFSYPSLFAILVVCLTTPPTTAATIVVDTLPRNDQASFNPPAGQTFTTGSLGGANTLSSIEIQGPTSRDSDDVLTYALALYTDTDGDHATWDPNVLLGTSQVDTVDVGSSLTTAFNFNGVTLADNTVYAIAFVDSNGAAVDQIRFGLTSANDISDGTLFSAGAIPGFGNGFDAAMRITTVPEPSTLAVGSIGLLLCTIVTRHRKSNNHLKKR